MLRLLWCLVIVTEDPSTTTTLKMLPGIGVFGTGDIVRALVPFLRAKGFRVEAIWGRTLEAAENVATELNIPFHTNKVNRPDLT